MVPNLLCAEDLALGPRASAARLHQGFFSRRATSGTECKAEARRVTARGDLEVVSGGTIAPHRGRPSAKTHRPVDNLCVQIVWTICAVCAISLGAVLVASTPETDQTLRGWAAWQTMFMMTRSDVATEGCKLLT